MSGAQQDHNSCQGEGAVVGGSGSNRAKNNEVGWTSSDGDLLMLQAQSNGSREASIRCESATGVSADLRSRDTVSPNVFPQFEPVTHAVYAAPSTRSGVSDPPSLTGAS